MTKLKTLKNIFPECICKDVEILNPKCSNEWIEQWSDGINKELKSEAVKDIKELMKIIKNNSVNSLSISFGDFLINPSENYREIFRIINYIKWKFNLTDEDLQEKK